MTGGGRNPDGHRLTHIGLCVSDLDRSLKFYRDTLGFVEVARRLEITDDGSAGLLGLQPPMDVHLVYLERDGIRVELLWYAEPGHLEPSPSPRPMNLVGLTHLAFRVGDFDQICERISTGGGIVLLETVTTFPLGNRGIMTLDPDGVRVELVERPATEA